MAIINTSAMPHGVTLAGQTTATYGDSETSIMQLFVRGVLPVHELISEIIEYKSGAVGGKSRFNESIEIVTQGFSIGEESSQDFSHLKELVDWLEANEYTWITDVDAPLLASSTALDYWTDILPLAVKLEAFEESTDYETGTYQLTLKFRVSA